MSSEMIAVVGAFIGGLITGLFNWLKAANQTGADERIDFRSSILKRLSNLEKRQAKLENDVSLWKGRYWSLYSWLVNLCQVSDIDVAPPSFHKMDPEDLEEQFKEIREANGNTD